VLGASSYTYAEATWSQQLPDWIASHVRCFEFMGCVAALLVPDNLKSAIKRACRYEPEATSTYEDLARVWRQLLFPVTTIKSAAPYTAAGSSAAGVFDFAPAALAR
jgi:hypothetical protein